MLVSAGLFVVGFLLTRTCSPSEMIDVLHSVKDCTSVCTKLRSWRECNSTKISC